MQSSICSSASWDKMTKFFSSQTSGLQADHKLEVGKMPPRGNRIFLQRSQSGRSCQRGAAPADLLVCLGQVLLGCDEKQKQNHPCCPMLRHHLCLLLCSRGWCQGKRSPWGSLWPPRTALHGRLGTVGRCLLSRCLRLISCLFSLSGTPGYREGSATPLLSGKELSWSLLVSFRSSRFLRQPVFTSLSAKYFAALETQLSSCSLKTHRKSTETAALQRKEQE